MTKFIGNFIVLSSAAAALMLIGMPQSAEAVVYCKRVGFPKGCVAAPAPAAVVYCTAPGVPVGCVVKPAAAAVVHCTAPGVPVGCVAKPAAAAVVTPGVGRPGVGVNRGGPVNRVGVR